MMMRKCLIMFIANYKILKEKITYSGNAGKSLSTLYGVFFFFVVSLVYSLSVIAFFTYINYSFNYTVIKDDRFKSFSSYDICALYNCKFIFSSDENNNIRYYGLMDKYTPKEATAKLIDTNYEPIRVTILDPYLINNDYYPNLFEKFLTSIIVINDDVGDNRVQYFLEYKTAFSALIITVFIATIICSGLFLWFNVRLTEDKLNAMKEKEGQKRNKTMYEKQVLITESLHHEFSPVIKALSILINNMYEELFACKCKDNLKVCILATNQNISKEELDKTNCFFKERKYIRKQDKILLDNFKNFEISLKRLEHILYLLRAGKNIKQSIDSNHNVYDSLMVTIELANVYLINKLKIKYEIEEDLVEKLKNIEIPMTVFSNAITTLVNNASEADADSLVISVSLKKPLIPGKFTLNDVPLFICVEIKDNGSGIRDLNGNLETDLSKIFRLGYSTKIKIDKQFIKNHTNSKLLKWLIRKERIKGSSGIFHKLLMNFLLEIERLYLTEQQNLRSDRGTGLTVNKMALMKEGGDLIIKETSETGTTFQITMPVQKKKQ